MKKIRTHKDLIVYRLSFKAGMDIYERSKSFPREEIYSLTDQIRRSSRSVSGNIAEGFQKRRYPKSFIARLSDSAGEAAETQTWLDYAFACNYLNTRNYNRLFDDYDHIISMLINMINEPENWTLK